MRSHHTVTLLYTCICNRFICKCHICCCSFKVACMNKFAAVGAMMGFCFADSDFGGPLASIAQLRICFKSLSVARHCHSGLTNYT